MDWVERQIYICDTCGNEFPLGEMKGDHKKVECQACYHRNDYGKNEEQETVG